MRVFILLLISGLTSVSSADVSCDLKSMQSSKLDISVKDTPFLKQIMAFSYDGEAAKYIPELKSSFSGMYYKGNKNEPLVTLFFASYKNSKTARQAADYLKTRWIKNRAGQYDVELNGNDVLWLSNNSLSKPCFKKVVAAEKSKTLRK
jgi:hypothetical protein